MIRVTIEMCPHGDESKPRTIATFKIANVGGSQTNSIYDVNAVIDGEARSTRLIHDRDAGAVVEKVLARARRRAIRRAI